MDPAAPDHHQRRKVKSKAPGLTAQPGVQQHSSDTRRIVCDDDTPAIPEPEDDDNGYYEDYVDSHYMDDPIAFSMYEGVQMDQNWMPRPRSCASSNYSRPPGLCSNETWLGLDRLTIPPLDSPFSIHYADLFAELSTIKLQFAEQISIFDPLSIRPTKRRPSLNAELHSMRPGSRQSVIDVEIAEHAENQAEPEGYCTENALKQRKLLEQQSSAPVNAATLANITSTDHFSESTPSSDVLAPNGPSRQEVCIDSSSSHADASDELRHERREYVPAQRFAASTVADTSASSVSGLSADEVGYEDSDADLDQISIRTAKAQMVNRLMLYACSWLLFRVRMERWRGQAAECAEEGRTTTTTQSSPAESLPATHGTTQKLSSGKGKRFRDSNDSKDISSDEDRPRKRFRNPIDAKDARHGRAGDKLACPFFKNDPLRFKGWRSCPGPGWDNISRLKEHMYKRHSQCHAIRCDRCQQSFPTKKLLSSHRRASQICELKQAVTQAGLDEDQVDQLKSRRRERIKGVEFTEEDKWARVYQIIFPETKLENVPSPYYECSRKDTTPQSSGDSKRYKRLLCLQFLEDLQQEFEAVAEAAEEATQVRLPEILSGILGTMREKLGEDNAQSLTSAAIDHTIPSAPLPCDWAVGSSVIREESLVLSSLNEFLAGFDPTLLSPHNEMDTLDVDGASKSCDAMAADSGYVSQSVTLDDNPVPFEQSKTCPNDLAPQPLPVQQDFPVASSTTKPSPQINYQSDLNSSSNLLPQRSFLAEARDAPILVEGANEDMSAHPDGNLQEPLDANWREFLALPFQDCDSFNFTFDLATDAAPSSNPAETDRPIIGKGKQIAEEPFAPT